MTNTPEIIRLQRSEGTSFVLQVYAAAKEAAVAGPTDIPLAGQAVFHLPAGRVFIP